VPERQHALVLESGGNVAEKWMSCDESASAPPRHDGTLDPSAIRLASWNVHKEADPGWESDLGQLIAETDVLLIQEVGVSTSCGVVEEAGFVAPVQRFEYVAELGPNMIPQKRRARWALLGYEGSDPLPCRCDDTAVANLRDQLYAGHVRMCANRAVADLPTVMVPLSAAILPERDGGCRAATKTLRSPFSRCANRSDHVRSTREAEFDVATRERNLIGP
jgi:hypothetical protein